MRLLAITFVPNASSAGALHSLQINARSSTIFYQRGVPGSDSGCAFDSVRSTSVSDSASDNILLLV